MKMQTNKDIFNRKTTTWLVVLMLVYVIFKLTAPILRPMYIAWLSPHEYYDVTDTRLYLEFINVIVHQAFNIFVGIFLIFEAKRANYNKALWFFLGAIFGLIALILFYVFRIYENTGQNDDK